MSNQREEETIPVGFRATEQQRDESQQSEDIISEALLRLTQTIYSHVATVD